MLTERKGPLRGLVELATGTYPGFVFGGSLGHLLPIFHFHEVTPEFLEPRLRYLAENGYRTVTSEAIARYVRDGVHPGPRSVALSFDDGWASLWTVAGPLLRQYGFTAIAFVIVGRVGDGSMVRPTLADGVGDPAAADRSAKPFVTWPELKTLHEAGLLDVQSHGFSHAKIFVSDRLSGFVGPTFGEVPLLERPLVSQSGPVAFLQPSELGAPLHPQRSRLSDGRRFVDDPAVRQRLREYVDARGGVEFFRRPHWRRELKSLWGRGCGRYETDAEREQAWVDELDRSRAILAERLKTPVRHFCFPWGVAGEAARRLAQRLGYETAFADRPFGRRAIRAGDDPYGLMRLNGRYVYCLPGRGRRIVGPLGGIALLRP